MEALILAAGKGKRINKYLKINKCLLKIDGKTLIEKIINDLRSIFIPDKISVVIGHKKNMIKSKLKNHNINFIFNKDYNKKEMLHSLYLGLKYIRKDALVVYSDIYFSKNIFLKIKKTKPKNICLPVSMNWKKIWRLRKKNIFKDCESLKFDKKYFLKEIGKKIFNEKEVMGQYMGIIFFPKNQILKLIKLYENKSFDKKTHITSFLNQLLKKTKIKCLPCSSEWYEFDDFEDYKNFLKLE